MLICGLDLETTGLDLEKDEIIEIALVLWDTERALPLNIFSSLVQSSVLFTPEITKLTGITHSDIHRASCSMTHISDVIAEFFYQADHIAAHNGEAFDKPMLRVNLDRYAGTGYSVDHTTWIDTMLDIPYPEGIKTRKLSHLAAEHGFLNPFSHRSLFDVMTMLKILAQYDIKEICKNTRYPFIKIEARCEPPWIDGGKSTKSAKENGFHWDAEHKIWYKTIRENALLDERKKAIYYDVRQYEILR